MICLVYSLKDFKCLIIRQIAYAKLYSSSVIFGGGDKISCITLCFGLNLFFKACSC